MLCASQICMLSQGLDHPQSALIHRMYWWVDKAGQEMQTAVAEIGEHSQILHIPLLQHISAVLQTWQLNTLSYQTHEGFPHFSKQRNNFDSVTYVLNV